MPNFDVRQRWDGKRIAQVLEVSAVKRPKP
jgi:hypothetical protein